MKFNDVRDSMWIDNHYYILKNTNIIEIYNFKFELVRKISIDWDIKIFLYNNRDKNFYFCLRDNNKLLYKTKDFKSYKIINLSMEIKENIKHISFSKCFYGILITTNKRVLHFDLTNNATNILFQPKEDLIEPSSCTRPFGTNFYSGIILINAIYCCKDLYIIYKINDFYYITKLIDGVLDKVIYKTDHYINSAFIIRNEIWILISKQYYQELINTKIKCDCSCPQFFYCSYDFKCSKKCSSPNPFNCNNNSYFSKSHNCSSFDRLEPCNNKCDQIKECCHSKDCNNSKDCHCQIVESIASVEKSLAKILDSESLKIKTAIDKSENIDELICVNSSVKDVIYYITILEFILTEKLKVSNKKIIKDCKNKK